jgi:hypothetical protein
MKASSIALRKIIFLLLLAVLILPGIQSKLNLFKVKPLQGAITNAPDTSFSVHAWFSGNYQEEKTKYLNDVFGFRNLFVRINNQVAFNLFDYALANGVIIGKNNYLYEESHIEAYCGLDFIGEDSISQRMTKLKYIQDTLAKLNKTLLLVFAPGKGYFYPEYIPDNYKKTSGPTNYDDYLKFAKSLGINYIDFNKYFIDNKNKSKYPLYPKYGNHWSVYGMWQAADSMISYIEAARKISMSHVYWKTIKMGMPDDGDADIENGMNLLFNLKSDSLAYPDIQFQSDSGKTKPSSIIISDSFYWGMFVSDISKIYSDSHFWYYNNEIYPDGLTTKQINLKDQIAKHDVIIIISTNATLPTLGWGFIEKAYNMFTGHHATSPAEERAQIIDIANGIKANPDWMIQMEADAKKGGISVDSAVMQNAKWVLDHTYKN